jgi:protein TonB
MTSSTYSGKYFSPYADREVNLKSLFLFSLPGLLVTLSFFWLMHLMLTTHLHPVKKIETPKMMELVPVIKEQPKPEVKAEEIPVVKSEPPKQPIVQPKPPLVKKTIVKVQKKVIEKPLPKPEIEKPVVKPVETSFASQMPFIPQQYTASKAATGLKTATQPSNSAVQKVSRPSGPSSGAVLVDKVSPKYPRRAYERQIEGWVKVEFTVTAQGTVSNPAVVAAEPSDTFDEAALDAVARFRFKPKMVDGVATSQRANQTIQFRIAN